MIIEQVKTNKAPEALGPYSRAVKYNGLVYLSGQLGILPEVGSIVATNIKDEATQVFENLKNILKASNSSLDNSLKVTVYLKDINDFSIVNEVYAKYFKNKPARSLVEVSKLPKNANIEVDLIAKVDF